MNYTALDGAITIERFPYSATGPLDRSAGVVLAQLPHPYAWHHGGGLAVAATGDLFVAIGDMEFRQFDPPGPQDPKLMLGGVMRIPVEVVEAEDPTWEPSPAAMVARGLLEPVADQRRSREPVAVERRLLLLVDHGRTHRGLPVGTPWYYEPVPTWRRARCRRGPNCRRHGLQVPSLVLWCC